MQRATAMAPRGSWPQSEAGAAVLLDYDSRHRRRIRLDCENGMPVLLDLPKAAALRDGDGLRLEDGGWIEVRAAPEDLVRITCDTPHDLHRVSWHLGNRHCPAEIRPDCVLIRRDHVIEDMLRGLGATVEAVHQPFDPERGAYDQLAASHDPSHSHDHSHEDGSGSGHRHDHD